MQEQLLENSPVRFVFDPNEEEKYDLITNEYLKKMPRDENLRYELIGGEIFVSTAPRFIHQLLSMRITGVFLEYFKKHPVGYILATPGLIFSEFDGVIPDLIYISHERIEEILDEESGKFHGAPEIVIEILSPGRANARRDLQIKRELYEIYQVPEYWVVDPFEKEISVFRFEKGELKKAGLFKENDILTTKTMPSFEISISELFGD
ncbi:Uma2 family endonuclease [soil metagenome]